MSDRNELWTATVYVSFGKAIVPAGVVPMVVVSYTLYFTTDMGSDAFTLDINITLARSFANYPSSKCL